jgi:glycosyltransferase involved in cell wall biosynthesis
MRIGNIEFLPEMPIGQIAEEIANADILLGGHFGSTQKATRVVPSKVYQILAMERALIATNTPANLELLCHRESAYLCPPDDPEALASAISCLHEDPQLRIQLARGGRNLYETTCSEALITDLLKKTISKLVSIE